MPSHLQNYTGNFSHRYTVSALPLKPKFGLSLIKTVIFFKADAQFETNCLICIKTYKG